MKLEPDKWRCKECYRVYSQAEMLRAASPFDYNDTLIGCPYCKSVDSFEHLCDEPGCMRGSSCGFPIEGGYRRTCFEHSELNARKADPSAQG